jgi:hypothetical protein
MRKLLPILLLAGLSACAAQPPCQDQLCIQQRQIDAYRSAAMLNAGARILAASQPQNVYVYHRY